MLAKEPLEIVYFYVFGLRNNNLIQKGQQMIEIINTVKENPEGLYIALGFATLYCFMKS